MDCRSTWLVFTYPAGFSIFRKAPLLLTYLATPPTGRVATTLDASLASLYTLIAAEVEFFTYLSSAARPSRTNRAGTSENTMIAVSSKEMVFFIVCSPLSRHNML